MERSIWIDHHESSTSQVRSIQKALNRQCDSYLSHLYSFPFTVGPFFTEGTFTKNTEAEVSEMMDTLAAWTSGQMPHTPTPQEYEGMLQRSMFHRSLTVFDMNHQRCKRES